MKRVLVCSIFILLTLFIFKNNIKASNDNPYKEGYHSISFDNLNSKNINSLFVGLNGTIIEIEVKTKAFTKSYRVNSNIVNNIEENITNKVLNDLKEMNKNELASIYKTSGFVITKINLICNNEELNIIKTRANL